MITAVCDGERHKHIRDLVSQSRSPYFTLWETGCEFIKATRKYWHFYIFFTCEYIHYWFCALQKIIKQIDIMNVVYIKWNKRHKPQLEMMWSQYEWFYKIIHVKTKLGWTLFLANPLSPDVTREIVPVQNRIWRHQFNTVLFSTFVVRLTCVPKPE